MRDMTCANNGCCGLSKGTQSDGLISDTSTEEYTSGSSTENLKGGKFFGKAIAKRTKEACNESQDSIPSKRSTSLHRVQTQCQLYIRWGVLLSFGILLWVALWMTDVLKPNPFLKEDLATAKKVTLKTGMLKKPAPSTWWFFHLWSYACDSIISVTTLEVLVFLCCVVLMVYLETHKRNKWGGTLGRLCYDQFYRSLLNTGAEQSETDNSGFHFNVTEEDLPPKESENKNCDDDSSKFSRGDVRNLITQDVTKVESNPGEKSVQYSNRGGTLSIENRISKSLKRSHNVINTRKRPRQLNDGKNYRSFSLRSNNLSRDVVTSELVLNKPDVDLSSVSSPSKNNETKRIPDLANLTCSVFNKSTSFMSEEIETWFEIPNSDRVEKVMNSFDMELENLFENGSNSLPQPFGETSRDMQRLDDNSNGCKCGERSKAVALHVSHNGGIVSSSPAFRRFLTNLAKDRLSETYL